MAILNARRLSVTAVVLFFAALWTPLIGMFFGVGEFAASDENRKPAVLPQIPRNGLRWIDLGDPFTAYLHDHFGFRGALVTSQALFRVKLLGVSSSPEVVLGRNGWLFYAGEKSMDDYRGLLPFPADELAGWVRLFSRRQSWLGRRGITVLVAIVPDKQTVYPEFLPPSIRKASERKRLDELMAAVRSASNVPVIDLRRALLDAKTDTSANVYSATDTHWNAAGAYAAYLELMHQIAQKYPDTRPIPFSESLRAVKYASGDLTRMLGLGSVWREMLDSPLSPPPLRSRVTAGGDVVLTHPGAPDRRLLMYGDSFCWWLVPYLAQHFGETAVSQSATLDPAMIAERHPDVVLFEFVERKLNNPAPQDPWDLMDRMDRQRPE